MNEQATEINYQKDCKGGHVVFVGSYILEPGKTVSQSNGPSLRPCTAVDIVTSLVTCSQFHTLSKFNLEFL